MYIHLLSIYKFTTMYDVKFDLEQTERCRIHDVQMVDYPGMKYEKA